MMRIRSLGISGLCSSTGSLFLLSLLVGCVEFAFPCPEMQMLWQVCKGHERPVSFVRFMGRQQLATASVDSSLALWDLNGVTPTLLRRYRGHTNVKNFVGLSVREEDQLMACGSEVGEAVAYHRAWSKPVAKQPSPGAPTVSQTADQAGAVAAAALPEQQTRSGVQEFASAVCWWPEQLGGFSGRCGGPVLAAAKSDGDLRLLTLVNAC
jgi:WD40 repeat protein